MEVKLDPIQELEGGDQLIYQQDTSCTGVDYANNRDLKYAGGYKQVTIVRRAGPRGECEIHIEYRKHLNDVDGDYEVMDYDREVQRVDELLLCLVKRGRNVAMLALRDSYQQDCYMEIVE